MNKHQTPEMILVHVLYQSSRGWQHDMTHVARPRHIHLWMSVNTTTVSPILNFLSCFPGLVGKYCKNILFVFTFEMEIEEFAANWRGGAMTRGAG